jgi:hypothetical protein
MASDDWQGGKRQPHGSQPDGLAQVGLAGVFMSRRKPISPRPDYLVILPERMQAVQARIARRAPLTMAWTRRKFGSQRRLVTLWAWLIRFPNAGPLPQISQE